MSKNSQKQTKATKPKNPVFILAGEQGYEKWSGLIKRVKSVRSLGKVEREMSADRKLFTIELVNLGRRVERRFMQLTGEIPTPKSL